MIRRIFRLPNISVYGQISFREKHKYPKNVRDRIDFSKVPKLNFDGSDKNDIIENLERGSGPGGQSVAKSSNAVTLKHTPTGVIAKCHKTRSVEKNRKIAQQKLVEELDNFMNGEDSVHSQAQRIESQLKEESKSAAKRNLQLKILPKLCEKEARIISKISFINENPQNYLDPQRNIDELNLKLKNVRVEIEKEHTKLNIVTPSK